MKTVSIEINGKKIQAPADATILQVARQNDIDIPTLCYNEQLEPVGVCRMCLVEVTKNKRTRLVASCVYPVEENLIVKTETEQINKIRRMIIEMLFPAVPEELAQKYCPQTPRFVPEHTDCTLCGLCVRFCAHINKNVAYFKGRGVNRHMDLVPGLSEECIYCSKCFDLCTGGLITGLYDKIDNQKSQPQLTKNA